MGIEPTQPSTADRDCSVAPAPAKEAAGQPTTAGTGAGAAVVHANPAPQEAPPPSPPAGKEPPVPVSDFIHVDGGLAFAGGSHPVNPDQTLSRDNNKPGVVASQAGNMSFTHANGGNRVTVGAGFTARESSLVNASAIAYTGNVKVDHTIGPVGVGVEGKLVGSNLPHMRPGDPTDEPTGIRFGHIAVTGDLQQHLPGVGSVAVHAEAGYRAGPGLTNRVDAVAQGRVTEHAGPVTLDFTGRVVAGKWTDRTPAGRPRRTDVLPSGEVKASIPVADHVSLFAKVGADGRDSNTDHYVSRSYANLGGGVGIQFSEEGSVKPKPK